MFKLSLNFEDIFSCAYGNFEEQNKNSESSIFVINYRINVYYNYANIESIIIIFLIKSSSRNEIRKQMWQYLWPIILPISKGDCKKFCPVSRIRPVSVQPALQ